MIQEEIDRAKRLHAHFGEALSRENALGELSERYRNAITKTQKVMEQVGVVECCTVCASKGPGSCCFQGAEEWYDQILLLINLVLGVQMPECREVSNGCLFVGNRGCKLLARHSFCVNYLCPSLKDSIKAPCSETLISVSGEELFRGWELEKSIWEWLQQHGLRQIPHQSERWG